ncbi:hypothetical protein [Streptomyces sp. NPDC015131]|uniref:hypothetical protein n=1 Tax=Streptomyces sp. NPDC015131 TaxID=3364941 RepID=UPI0036FAB29A
MRRILEFAGSLMLLIGAGGVLHELTGGRFRLLGFTRHLTESVGLFQGRELFAHVLVAVAGFAVLMTGDRLGRAR